MLRLPEGPRTSGLRLKPLALVAPTALSDAAAAGGERLTPSEATGVTDASSLKFIEAFYQALLQQQTVGAAVQQARLVARLAGDPTWFSYGV